MARSDTDLAEADAGPAGFRQQVVDQSIRLFAEHGYESTTVEQIAAAAGVSRRTLFRQFRSKEDMIFADHETLLARIADDLSGDAATDPWAAVCVAAEFVFDHFLAHRDLAVRRLRVVTQVPALRERELVTTYRYQRIFEEYLRRRLPDESRVRIVGYAAAVTSAHNYLLRRMIRGEADATPRRLADELASLRSALGGDGRVAEREVAVITFAAGTPADEITRAVSERLRTPRTGTDSGNDDLGTRRG